MMQKTGKKQNQICIYIYIYTVMLTCKYINHYSECNPFIGCNNTIYSKLGVSKGDTENENEVTLL